MTPERWQRIDDLLQEALARPSGERQAFLGEVCPDDDTRAEIESLLSFHEQADSFLEVPAFEAVADLLCEDQSAEMVGLRLGPYEIESLLGAGGMGEVYLAEDTKLNRKVAIKFLPAYLEADDLAKKRLVREARAAAKIDHSNICTIYEVVEDAGYSYIVMQYVRGETLAARIQREPLALRDALDIAAQVADALAEAHAHKIVHRDIKPQNVMLTARAQVKVLDFGLAKVVRPADVQARTQSQLSTPGLIVGTAAYMSPEQARGDSIDVRSDLFSLGVMLYECVASRAPFTGATPVEICAQVIHVAPPPPSHWNPQAPSALDAVILKAMAKDPAARYQSAGDMLQALRETQTMLPSGNGKLARPIVRRFTRYAVRSLAVMYNAGRRPRIFIPAVAILTALIFVAFMAFPHAAPLQPSADTLYWYNIGTNDLRNGAYYDASILLQRAVAAGDSFPLAHARLGEAWVELGYVDKANAELLQARLLSHDLSPLPRLDELYIQAITHVVLRQFTAAIENYQQIIREVPEAEKASAYVDLGRAYEKNNDVEKAIASYTKAIELAPSGVAAFLRLGILYSERGHDIQRALEAFQKAEDLYQTLRDFEGVTEVLYQRGLLYYWQSKPPESQAQLEKAIEITQTTNNHYQKIRALSVLSNISAAEGHALLAEQQGNQAIEEARANRIDNQVTSGFFWLGNIYLMSGDFSNAEKSYQESLDYARKDNDRLSEAGALMSLGSLNTLQRNTDDALRYLEPARLFYQQGGYHKLLSLTLTLIGRAYRNKGDYEAALTTFRDLLERGEQADDLSHKALAHEEIGSVCALEELYPDALTHYEECYKINKLLNAKFDLGYSAMHRGSILWQVGRYKEAGTSLNEAFAIAMNPDSTYKHLLASVQVTNAHLELSQWRLQGAKAMCHQVIDLAGTQYKSVAVEAKCILGLAETRSGALHAGMILCEEAVRLANKTDDPQLLATAWLASAEVLVESGQAQRALERALQAQESFARLQQQDSEWRAWLIAAQSERQLGDDVEARALASNAASRLSDLEQKWGPEASNGYRSRPDIQRFLNQLDQIRDLSTPRVGTKRPAG